VRVTTGAPFFPTRAKKKSASDRAYALAYLDSAPFGGFLPRKKRPPLQVDSTGIRCGCRTSSGANKLRLATSTSSPKTHPPC
jgi:hypothetical protein